MGNISPRQSKSYHDELTHHLTLTPNRSSWKKQLHILNQKLKLSRYRSEKIQQIESNHVKKSFSLFSMKQTVYELTNKENPIKISNNSTNQNDIQNQQHRSKHESVKKRRSTFLLRTSQLTKSQSQYYQQYQIELSSKSISTNSIHSLEKPKIIRKTIIQASTSELLRCLSDYLCSTCSHLLPGLDPIDCIIWIKSADRQLILQGWQEQVFVNPANIVFFYLILRETLTSIIPSSTIKNVREIHAIILTCLYLSFSYMGHEITYPLKPFVTDHETRDVFWQRVVLIMGQLSSKMLAINQDPKFFTQCFSDLKQYNLVVK